MARVTNPDELRVELKDKLDAKLISEVGYARGIELIQDYDHVNPENFWLAREAIRCKTGIYPSMQFETSEFQVEWRNLTQVRNRRFLHPALENPALVAYTIDEEKGRRDIQTVCRIGKYLTRESSDMLNENQINAMANEYTQRRKMMMADADDAKANTGMFITRDPQEITHVYRTNATTSCMSYCATKWQLRFDKLVERPTYWTDALESSFQQWEKMAKMPHDEIEEALTEFIWTADGALSDPSYIHPAMMYAFSDHIAVAYYKDNNRIVARSLINQETQKYTRIYGQPFLGKLLEKEGYENGDITPFKVPLLKVESYNNHETRILMPYVDGENTPGATINLKTGDVHVRSHGKHGVRNYASGMTGFSHDRACNFCGEVLVSRSSGLDIPIFEGVEDTREDFVCYDCAEHHARSLIVSGDYTLGWFYRFDDIYERLFFGVIRDDHAVTEPEMKVDYMVNDITKVSTMTPNAGATWMEVLVGKNPEYLRTMTANVREFATGFDSIVGGKAFLHDMTYAILPDGEKGWTTLETCDYMEESYIISKASEYDPPLVHIRHPLGSDIFLPRDRCVEAVVDMEKNTELLPYNHCTYLVGTREWVARSLSRSRRVYTSGLERDTLLEHNIQDHGSNVMQAAHIVMTLAPNITPFLEEMHDLHRSPEHITATLLKWKDNIRLSDPRIQRRIRRYLKESAFDISELGAFDAPVNPQLSQSTQPTGR